MLQGKTKFGYNKADSPSLHKRRKPVIVQRLEENMGTRIRRRENKESWTLRTLNDVQHRRDGPLLAVRDERFLAKIPRPLHQPTGRTHEGRWGGGSSRAIGFGEHRVFGVPMSGHGGGGILPVSDSARKRAMKGFPRDLSFKEFSEDVRSCGVGLGRAGRYAGIVHHDG